ncbi:hypothetical protein PMAYCL1PPCAC_28441, partial [Pristionchus mayeri]
DCAMDDKKIRLVLGPKKRRGGKTLYYVAWKEQWVDASIVPQDTISVDKLEILGLTGESDQKRIREAKFVIKNSNSTGNENKKEIWTYAELREKAPELLLDFYEGQLLKK